jgi:hypothetical protein
MPTRPLFTCKLHDIREPCDLWQEVGSKAGSQKERNAKRDKLKTYDLFLLTAIFWFIPMARGHKSATLPDPVLIARMHFSKTLFVANLGTDSSFSFEIPGGANVCYNESYESLKWWEVLNL